jgi:transposase
MTIEIQFTEEDISELHRQRYEHPHPHIQKKMEVLFLKSQGFRVCDICLATRISGNTFDRYLHQYEDGGVEGLKRLNFYRRESELLPHAKSIEEYFMKNPPSTAKEAAKKIEEITGVKRSPDQVRKFLKSIGMKRLVTGSLPSKADPKKQAEFKKKA